ncbi:MAG: LysR family transcriptional regulator [Pseudolabrys sp.]
MDLRLLRYFVAVAEEQHFGRAAEKLGITPPTLTVQIQTLERSLGTALLVRRGKSISLSPAGQRFLVETRNTLKQAEKAERIARQAARGEIATITISYLMQAAMSGMISEALAEFSKTHPGVSFRLQRMETIATLRAIVEGNVDVGFTRAPVRFPAELTGISITRDPLLAAVPADHPLAKQKSISMNDLTALRYLAPAIETEIGFRGNIAEISSATLPHVSEASAADIVSVLVLVGAGMGGTIVTEPNTRIAIPNVAYRPIKDLKTGAERVLVYRKSENSLAVLQFVQTLRKFASKT